MSCTFYVILCCVCLGCSMYCVYGMRSLCLWYMCSVCVKGFWYLCAVCGFLSSICLVYVVCVVRM